MGPFSISMLILSAILITCIVSQTEAYGEVLEWKSEYDIGILNPEPSEFGLDLKVTTNDKTSLMVSWEKSSLLTKVSGYKLMRKTMNSDYKEIAQFNQKQTSYLDSSLPADYYGYKIIPIIDNNQTSRQSTASLEQTTCTGSIKWDRS